jgi:uncharacterized protein DUF5681
MSRTKVRRKSPRDSSPGDYAVGYGQPPKAHQFKPGQSGNPKGRPKGAKSEATILRDLLHERIEVQQAGRSRKIPTIQALLLRCRNAALKGDLKALAFLLNRYGLVEGAEPEAEAPLDQNDREVVDAFIKRLEADSKAKKECP